MACSVASITVYWIDNSNFQAVVSGFANASLPCVLGSHLLFNLKEAVSKNVVDSGGTELSPDDGTITITDVSLIGIPSRYVPLKTYFVRLQVQFTSIFRSHVTNISSCTTTTSHA